MAISTYRASEAAAAAVVAVAAAALVHPMDDQDHLVVCHVYLALSMETKYIFLWNV